MPHVLLIEREQLLPVRQRLLLEEDEVTLASAADGTEPCVWDVLEGGARRDAAVWIAFVRIVDEAAGLADPALQRRRTHGF